MSEKVYEIHHLEPSIRETSDERVWEAPAYLVVETALEVTASQRGQALGSGFAYPVTLTQVARWTEAVEARGFQLAPASALTVRR